MDLMRHMMMSSVTRYATKKDEAINFRNVGFNETLSSAFVKLPALSKKVAQQPVHVLKCHGIYACTHRNVLQIQLSKVSITLY